MKSRPTYHIVSHSHWDREWYFPFERFRSMLVEMMEDLLEIFDADRSFRSYTLDGQMAMVADYLEIRPERRDRISRLVKSGRLFIGPWYILSDEFLASGESQIRNLQFGIRMGGSLGGVMKVGYIPDQFGHIAQMPQILAGFDIDTAIFYRGFGGEPGQEPSEYWWVSPNGSRVLLHHMQKDGYSAGYFATRDEQTILQKFDRLRRELDRRATTSQRLFFNGGDHHWPDREVTAAIRLIRRHYEAEILHSNFPDYFAGLRRALGKKPKIGLLQGETRFGYRHAFCVLGGVFSSRMYLKQLNAECEQMLSRKLEPFNVLAGTTGMRSKTPQIEQAWKYVIQNQDHDAICGTSTDEVHREMAVRYEKAKAIGSAVIEDCFASLIPYDENAKHDDRYIFIVNPSPFPRTEIVETHVDFFLKDVVVGLNPETKVSPRRPPVEHFRIEDPAGKVVPFHNAGKKEEYGIVYSRHDYPGQTLVDRCRMIFAAENIPPMGWKAYKIVRGGPGPKAAERVKVGTNALENQFLRVDVATDGSVRILDKQRNLTYSGLNVFEDSGDVGDEYDYSYPERDEVIRSTHQEPAISIAESTPFRGSVAIDYSLSVPAAAGEGDKSRSRERVTIPVRTCISLGEFSRRVDFKTTVHNTARDHRLRVLFFTGVDTVESHAETPFAVVSREHHEFDVTQFPFEHPAQVAPMQRFVTVRDASKGMTLLTKGLPEYEVSVRERGLLALTLLRCVGKLSGRDLITRPGGAAGWWTETPEAQCLGWHTFEYSLVPHSPEDSSWQLVLQEAETFSNPLIAVPRKNDQAVLEKAFLSLEPPALQLSAFKEAEDGKGVILRVVNPLDQTIDAKIHSETPLASVYRCKLNETNLRALRADAGHDLRLTIAPFEIVSLRLRFSKRKG